MPIDALSILCEQLTRDLFAIAKFLLLYTAAIKVLHCVSKNAPNLANRSLDRHGLIVTIFGNEHQHTFKMVCTFNFPCPFTVTYFICF